MVKPKITIVIGTRPEAIKLAPLYLLIKNDLFFKPRLILTGQHLELVDNVLKTFSLEPDKNFKVMKKNQM